MLNTNQKGFTLIEGLLIFIVIAIIGGTGYYVWHSQKETDKTYNAADKSAQSTPQKTQKKTPSPETKYFEIKELGIKFAVTGKISDAYYAKSPDGYYYFSVHSFDSVPGLEGCKASDALGADGASGLIVAKIGEQNDMAADPTLKWDQASVDGLTKVGDTYYGFTKGNGLCYDPNAANADSLAARVTEVQQAFKAATPTITKL